LKGPGLQSGVGDTNREYEKEARVTRTSVTINFPPVPGASKYSLNLNGQQVASSTIPSFRTVTLVSGSANTATITATVPVPPPPVAPSTVGELLWGDHFPVATNLDKMGLLGVSDPSRFAAAKAATTGKVLGYGTGSQVQTYQTVLPVATVRTNGWLLHDATGNEIHLTVNTDGYLANVADPSYAKAWAAAYLNFVQSNHIDGIHIDNFIIDANNFGVTYPLYDSKGNVAFPDQASWADAQIAWITTVGTAFKNAGLYVLVNGAAFINGDVRSNDGSLTNLWIPRYAPYVSAVEVEYYLQNANNIAQMALVGPEWWNEWDGKTSNQVTAESAGIDFCGVVYLIDNDVQKTRYARGSWLLNWNGTRGGGFVAYPAVSDDIWNIEMGKNPGFPTGPKTQLTSGVWKRPFTVGDLYVNPTASAVTITGVGTILSGDAVIPSA
jgi:hypothetical protein